ncbi:peptide/nickel transport system permease protein [Serratia fonticola]|jgi:peptide/nickel transport system permease protein|uniref:Peptide/nickel transport system permease protein n=1 Tax=Serratia fonticola TaxID=47917 RepID=A0A559T9U7_SERFO|nr:ABC transporter permease [Serratia fonticola]TQI81086.1 peptide/nickel transport system permease protein [Serratia fonticola]TQI96890.1 peptide/nickel transport system permease protein [Serratia fonticola]TVZ71385.1 peptide/nickel transport system permease protein [Serratia fonticola]
MTYNPNRALCQLLISLVLLLLLVAYGGWVSGTDVAIDLLARRQPPSAEYWFGTDSLGRDLWLRCFQGMTTSLQIGLSAAFVSGLLAMLAAGLSAIGKPLDYLIRGLIDCMLALPHLLLLILICFTLGGGKQGVILAVALTHWPKLALILRAEILRIRETDYVMLSHRLGNSSFYRWRHHLLPLLLPQWFVGTLLMFPHAVLHSAALSFIGFGLAPHDASLGLLLADALRYLSSGAWWLALFPGLILVGLVLIFDRFARSLQQMWLRIA